MVTCTAAAGELTAADGEADDETAEGDGLAADGLTAADELTAGVGVLEADPPPEPLEQAVAARSSSRPRAGRRREVFTGHI
ncbi:hypothetical protein ACFQ0T_05075 [Kitasatospora gansuensis]